MTTFLLLAALATACALAALLRPLWWRGTLQVSAPTARRQNTEIYRDELARLERDIADGTLAAGDHAQAREELQRRMLADTALADPPMAAARAPRRTALVLALALPIAAAGLYALLGNPAALQPAAAQQAKAADDVERMVSNLAKKLEADPSNLKGWAMLARSYKVMGRSVEAEKAFERAGTSIDGDAELLANYADVAATNAGGSFHGMPAVLVAKALAVDPDNVMALWLAGSAALNDGDYRTALVHWQRVQPLLEPGSEDARNLQGSIDEVQAKAGIAPKVAAANSGAVAVARSDPAAPGPERITGTVEVDPGLRSRLAAGDFLMVIARAPGNRMPLAVLRVPAGTWPARFTLDDSLSMSPQARLSGATRVEVQARISKRGQAVPEPGDLLSGVQAVQPGSSGLALVITQVKQ